VLWSSGALVLTLTPPRDATASLPRLYSYSSSYSYSSTLLPLLYYYGNQPEPLAVALATDTLGGLGRGCDAKDHRALVDDASTARVHAH